MLKFNESKRNFPSISWISKKIEEFIQKAKIDSQSKVFREKFYNSMHVPEKTIDH